VEHILDHCSENVRGTRLHEPGIEGSDRHQAGMTGVKSLVRRNRWSRFGGPEPLDLGAPKLCLSGSGSVQRPTNAISYGVLRPSEPISRSPRPWPQHPRPDWTNNRGPAPGCPAQFTRRAAQEARGLPKHRNNLVKARQGLVPSPSIGFLPFHPRSGLRADVPTAVHFNYPLSRVLTSSLPSCSRRPTSNTLASGTGTAPTTTVLL
jgi:hypothetical protein